MKVKWKILFTSTILWLSGEIYLNLAGLDEFADYSQFLENRIDWSSVVTNLIRVNSVAA